MIVSHSTILLGVKLTNKIEETLIDKFGEDFVNILIVEYGICILPYDRCISCEALLGIMVCDIDETSEEFYKEVKNVDLATAIEDLTKFFDFINLPYNFKIYNVLHCV